jgi:putative SOS response-associated peptidase YedK
VNEHIVLRWYDYSIKEYPVCYFSSISVGFKIIDDRFGVRFLQTESFQPVYSASAFTFPSLPVIADDDQEHITFMQWGMIPFWVKNHEAAADIRGKALNARCETIFEKPAFRFSAHSKRCLVISDGFFEWRHIGKNTYPYYIRLTSLAPFAFAGVWDRWTNPETKELIRSFSVVTTKANSLLEKIHNTRKRMPVILPREREKSWLDHSLGKDVLQQLLQPYDPGEMEAFPVSKFINKLGFNTTNPEVLERQDYADLPPL